MVKGFIDARHNLQVIANMKVKELTKQYGFDFIDTDLAPNTFTDLMVAYQFSLENKKALPVFSGASDNTIYFDKQSNWGFRFWHDMVHCANKLDFSLQGEIQTANLQLIDVAKHFGQDSLEYKIFKIDTIGQATYSTLYGIFPDNQIEFVKHLLK